MWIYPDDYNPWRIVAYFAFIPVCLIINALLRSFGLLEPRCQRCRSICTKHEELRQQETPDADGVGVTVWICPHCGWRREREFRIERPVVNLTLNDARSLLRAGFERDQDEPLHDGRARQRSPAPYPAPDIAQTWRPATAAKSALPDDAFSGNRAPSRLTTDESSGDSTVRRGRLAGATWIATGLVVFLLLRNVIGLLALVAAVPVLLYGAAIIAFTHDPLPGSGRDHSQPWRNGQDARHRRSRTRFHG